MLRHARALVFDKRLEERWDEPLVLSVIEFHLNNSVSQETDVRPFEAKFGTPAGTYYRLPSELSPDQASSQFLRLLNDDLKTIGEIISKTNAKVITARRGAETEETTNEYQPGDFVLHREPGSSKLKGGWHGPLKVLRQQHNNVEAQHLATGTVAWYFVGRLKLFAGDQVSAREAAMRDQDQYAVDTILTYQGNPLRRSETRYYVRFNDGDERWLPYTSDLYDTVQFGEFILLHRSCTFSLCLRLASPSSSPM